MKTITMTAAEVKRRLASRPKREADIQREILDYLATLPHVYAWKAGSGLLTTKDGRRVRMGKAGVSDIIGWVETRAYSTAIFPPTLGGPFRYVKTRAEEYFTVPRFLAIEVKRPGKEPTVEQRVFLGRVRRSGGVTIVATSVDDVRAVVSAPSERWST